MVIREETGMGGLDKPSESASVGGNQADIRSVLSKREHKLEEYRQQRDDLNTELKTLNHRRKKVISRLRDVGNAIYYLLHESEEVPSITDHAVVRYLERVQGMDIRSLKIEIANHKQAQREGNVIVTVNAIKEVGDD